MQEMQVQSQGLEDPLEEEMATHSPALLPRESHGQRSLAGHSPWGGKALDTTDHPTRVSEDTIHLNSAPFKFNLELYF